MKNIYTVEKFKQSFDAEGNEILTKVDAAKGMPEIKATNSIGGTNIFANFIGTTNTITSTNNSPDFDVYFNTYNLAISTQKFESLGNYFNGNTSSWTNDATSEDPTKGIVGARFAGEDDSVRSGTDILVHTMRNRFSPPATVAREINTIFLARIVQFSTSSDNAFFSSVVLDVPCIQESDEVLIITYRYVFDKLELAQSLHYYNNNPTAALLASEQIGTFTGRINNFVPFGKVANLSYQSAAGIKSGKAIVAGAGGSTLAGTVGYTSTGIQYQELAQEVSIDLTVNDLVGSFINSISAWNTSGTAAQITNDGTQVYNSPVDEVLLRRPTDTAVQNTFNKVKTIADAYSSVPSPFYDVGSAGSSLGNVSVTDDVSSGNTSYDITTGLGELLRVDITTGGVAGTAEYKISTRMFTSFKNASSWETDQGSYLLVGSRYYENTGEKTMLDANYRTQEFGLIDVPAQLGVGAIKPLQLGEVAVLTRTTDTDNNGLFLHSIDISNESTDLPSILDSTTVSGFLATDIRGFCTAEDGTMYVACAATGLWRLTRVKGDLVSATTATLINTTGATVGTSCHAVNFGRYGHRFETNSKLVAAFGTELCVSPDGGTTWNMYNAGTTPAFNPAYTADSIIGIAIHPSHNDVIVTTRTVEPAFEYYLGMAFNLTTSGDGVTNQWDGDTGTIVTGIAHMSANRALCQYGGANNLCVPVSNTGTYKWTMKNTTNETSSGLYGFNTVATLVAAPAFNATGIEFIYDSTVDDSIVVYGLTSPRAVVGSYWESILTSTPEVSRVLDNDPSGFYSMTFIPLGRGVFIGSGAINYYTSFTTDQMSNLRNAFYGAMRAFHFSWADAPTYDFYENNPLNIWYDYGWNGSAWVLSDVSSKVSAATVQPLVKGLSATFVNLAGNPTDPTNFIAGEVFDVYAFDGIIKDDYTSLSFDTLFYPSLNQTGNTFSPATVPATSAGASVRLPIGVETYKPTGTAMNTNNGMMYYEKGKASQTAISSSTIDVLAGSSLLSISPEIPDADFTYEFKIGLTVSNGMMDTSTTAAYSQPTIVLADVLDTTTTGYNAFDYGIRPTIFTGNPSGLRLYIWEGVGLVSTINLTEYAPKTDVFKFVRNDTAGTFTLTRNDIVLYTFSGSPVGQAYKAYLLGVGATLNNTINANILGIGTQVSEMYLSFTDARRITKIGNGTTTGAWADNFGKLLTLELERGIKKIFLDGVEASIVYDYNTDLPLAGEVKINSGTGELIFNPADAGKTITGEWRYLPSVNK